jgi:hypothetical protein
MPPRDISSGRYSPSTAPIADRFWSQVSKGPNCWEWTGGLTGAGYGAFYPDSVQVGAHIWSWTQANGPVLDSGVIDHLCSNRRCVNPDHLEVTTRGDNVLRSDKSQAGINLRKTHCIRGHELSGDNLKLTPNVRNPNRPDWRQCRTCTRIRGGERRRRAAA